MLNRFKNAFYGPSGSSDDSSVDLHGDEAALSRKIRGALTRSSSFREDLLKEMSRSRDASDTSQGESNSNRNSNNSGNSNHLAGGVLQRGKSQILRKPTTIPEEDESTSSSTTANTANRPPSRRAAIKNGDRNGTKLAKFRYTRPEFLQLRTDDEILVSADHQIRPIILPRDVSRLPWKSGYAECINAGKSPRNEDQAACHQDVAIRQSSLLRDSLSTSIKDQIPWTYFGLFDGHAGTAVAVAAAAQLHNIISEKLRQVSDLLIALEFDLEDLGDGEESCESNEDSTATGYASNDDEDDEFTDCASSPNGSGNNIGAAPPASPRLSSNSTVVSSDDQTETGLNSGSVGPAVEGAQNGDSSNSSPCDTSKQRPRQQQAAKQGTNSLPPTKAAAASQQTATATSTSNNEPRQGRRQARLGELEHETLCLPKMVDICRLNINMDTLIRGTLESAFWEMDRIIASDKQDYKMAGGCTAIVSLFILGKLYVCNAGDSRAIVYKGGQVLPMSFDFTPTSERQRILRLGLQRPEFMGNEFTHLEFLRRPGRKDLGKQMLYKDAYMTGWSMKTITYDDLKFPLVWGEGKRSRVLATIGVTRGLGDHELRSQFGSVPIKPFLTPEPEVRQLALEHDAQPPLTPDDVLIMGSDGLWDVTGNEEAADIVRRSFDLFPDNEESRSKYRYITAAQDLVIQSRGHTSNWNNVWRTADDRLASLDDISTFVVPLKPYRDEYLEWRRLRSLGGRRSPKRQVK